jgi:hypothetical protein
LVIEPRMRITRTAQNIELTLELTLERTLSRILDFYSRATLTIWIK